jgi:hypothetical protein
MDDIQEKSKIHGWKQPAQSIDARSRPMKNHAFPKISRSILAVLMAAFLGAACIPTMLQPTPMLQTVEVTREVTQEVTFEVTREVTLVVEIPVTITPTFTLENTPIMDLTNTPGSSVAMVRLPTAAQCLYGPSAVYLNKYTFPAETSLEAVGRSVDGAWINVQTTDHAKVCWLQVISVHVETGNPADLPEVDPVLSPYSAKYNAPLKAVSTNRVGNEVTVFWLPVSMTESDYRGYLIEAWVCQAGQQVFVAKTHVPEYAQNQANTMQAVLFIDEPGCSSLSRARIYAVEKSGYSMPYYMVWPAASPTATATP